MRVQNTDPLHGQESDGQGRTRSGNGHWKPETTPCCCFLRRRERVRPAIPILFFGDLDAYAGSPQRVLTVGLNPSRTEFPPEDPFQRFPLAEYSRSEDQQRYLDALSAYFATNPYSKWFRSFEPLLNGMSASYYDHQTSTALHTDICSPVATEAQAGRHRRRRTPRRRLTRRSPPVHHRRAAAKVRKPKSDVLEVCDMPVDYDRAFAEVTAPMGLEYRPDFLAASEEDRLLAHIVDSEWLTDLSRRVMHFGYKYDYTSRRLDETARIGPLPEWLAQLSDTVREAASDEAKHLLDPRRPFEQAIINEYLPGQGIAPHIDRDCFGPVVATVSLGSAVNMDFCRDSTGEEHEQRLAPRSLVLLRGDARLKWRHGIAKRHSDTWKGQRTKRQRRVSITFRQLDGGSPS